MSCEEREREREKERKREREIERERKGDRLVRGCSRVDIIDKLHTCI